MRLLPKKWAGSVRSPPGETSTVLRTRPDLCSDIVDGSGRVTVRFAGGLRTKSLTVARSPGGGLRLPGRSSQRASVGAQLSTGREDVGRSDRKGHDLPREEGDGPTGFGDHRVRAPRHISPVETRGAGWNAVWNFRCDAQNGGTRVSGKLWMEPRGVTRGLVLLMRPKMKRMLGELPDDVRRAIEARD